MQSFENKKNVRVSLSRATVGLATNSGANPHTVLVGQAKE